MKKFSLFLMTVTLLLSSIFLGCQNNVTPEITTGSIQGSITLNGSTDDVLGLDVFIAGTSYVSKVAADGNYEISNIPAATGYVLCVQNGKTTQIIKENVEVKAGEVTTIETAAILSSEWIQSSLVWKGSFETAPENPEENWAYYNTTDGCSYIWNGTSWDVLAGADENGVGGDSGIDGEEEIIGYHSELNDIISDTISIQRNSYAENYQTAISVPYDFILPISGDKFSIKWTFTSDIDIKNFRISFADCSTYVNSWKELSPDTIIEKIPANKAVTIEETITLTEKAIGNVSLIIRYNAVDTDAIATLTTSSSSITLLRGEDPQLSSNSISCTATEEGIKFTGSLLSNIADSTAKCVINISDINNGILMTRDYTLHEATYETWEVIYPLVEKDKTYKFEVTMDYQANVILSEKFTVTAIGGLGEYKVENADTYSVSLSKDKKSLSRTAQEFTDNPNVKDKIIDYGTKYAIYSNNDSATSIWDGIWRHDSVHWASKTNQECDLTTLETWLSYEGLLSCLKGRRLGTRTVTHIKIAGYTYNGTADFELNDYKETFFDWDDEEENKYLIVYQNPETGDFYQDVPGTSLYYVKVDLDENGNFIFTEKDADGAMEVYGQLISYGDKIYEPVYVPTKIEGYNFTGSWEANCVYQTIEQINFPYNSQDFWTTGDVIPVILSPEFKPDQYKVNFVDENGNEILDSIVTKSENFTLPEIPYKQNYLYDYWQDKNGNTYRIYENIVLTEAETTFVADYELERLTLNFYNEDGSYYSSWIEYNRDCGYENSYFLENGSYVYFTNVYAPSAPPSDETKEFIGWQCKETSQEFYADTAIYDINTVAPELNFYPVYK